MVNLSIVLDTEPVNTPDAEFRIRSAWRTLVEMVLVLVEGERDSRVIPGVDIPLVSDSIPSPSKDTAVINE